MGARICVRGCFNRLVLPLVAELRAWTAGTKEHAIDLLTTMLTYAEEGTTQHVQPILLAFLQIADDSSIAEKVSRFPFRLCRSVMTYFRFGFFFVSSSQTLPSKGRRLCFSLMEGTDLSNALGNNEPLRSDRIGLCRRLEKIKDGRF